MNPSPGSGTARALLIFPCNGNGVEALDCLGERFRLLGFIDDTPDKQGRDRYGHPIMGRAALADWPDAQVLAVPGSPTSYRRRRQLIESLGIDGDRFARVIHPAAHVSRHARIGRNVLIMAGAVITGNAVIGDHVCILPNSVVHHDCIIGAWTLIGSNVTVAGHTVVGESCYIGSGASIINGKRIGDGALVGLASTVITDVPADARVAGNPARPLRRVHGGAGDDRFLTT